MESTLRIFASLVLVTGVSALALQVDKDEAANAFQDLCNLPANYMALEKAKQNEKQVTEWWQRLEISMEKRDHIIRDLASGRLELRSAIAQYINISENCGQIWDVLAQEHPEWSKEKRCAHLLIDYIEIMMLNEHQPLTDRVRTLRTEVEGWVDG